MVRFERLALRPFRATYVFGVGVVFGLSAAAFFWWNRRLFGAHPVTVPDALYERALPYLVAAAFALPIASLAMRLPLRGGSLKDVLAPLAVHVPCAAVYCLVFAAVLNAIGVALGHVRWPFWRAVLWSISAYGQGQLTFYFSVLGVTLAVRYHREARARAAEKALLEASLSQARVEALRAQLNPHFLFNTLNAIAVLALRGEGAAVAQAIGRLSEILRVSLDTRRGSLVPLVEEMELVRAYADIQVMRYGDRLTVDLCLAPEAGAALVPALVTQPLVENAVRHGIAARPGPGRVEVSARRECDALVIRVADSGPGFGTVPAAEGIGLSNTRERLERHYGAAAALLCANAPEGGAVVTLRLPFRAAALADAS
jgi:signal transduction histidine kinase